MNHETMTRSIVKALSWRMWGIIILGIIGWLVTHEWTETLKITSIFHIIRTVLFVPHERFWLKIKLGTE